MIIVSDNSRAQQTNSAPHKYTWKPKQTLPSIRGKHAATSAITTYTATRPHCSQYLSTDGCPEDVQDKHPLPSAPTGKPSDPNKPLHRPTWDPQFARPSLPAWTTRTTAFNGQPSRDGYGRPSSLYCSAAAPIRAPAAWAGLASSARRPGPFRWGTSGGKGCARLVILINKPQWFQFDCTQRHLMHALRRDLV